MISRPADALAARLERYLEGAEPYNDICLMLFAHGTDSVGIASIARWRQILQRARRQGRFVGVEEDKYPRDFAILPATARSSSKSLTAILYRSRSL